MKKTIAMILVVVLCCAASVGLTVAYLTDRDSAANIFTVGNVAIDLTEDFEQGATLIPGVDINKKPSITNIGNTDAWVWATVAIPTALDEEYAYNNVVHFNFAPESVNADEWTWTDDAGKWMVRTEEIDGVDYNVYTVLYQSPLKPGETTESPFMTKVYVDPHIDIDPDGNWWHVEGGVVTGKTDGEGNQVAFWNSNTNGNPVFYVSAYAIQEDTFANVRKAYAAYNEQWGDKGTEYFGFTTVSDNAGLADAVANGEKSIVLQAGTYTLPTLKNGEFTLIGGKDTVIDLTKATGQRLSNTDITFEGVTIQGTNSNYVGIQHAGNIVYNNVTFNESTTLYGESAVFNNCTFNLTSRYIWTYSSKEVTFNNCTFNTAGKAVLVYAESSVDSQTVNFNDCTFKATETAYTGTGDACAAVEIDGSLIKGTYTVNFTGTNEVDPAFGGLWRIKDQKTPSNVTINE